MKQAKKLTRDHKEFLRKKGADSDLWTLLSEDPFCYIYQNKVNGTKMMRDKATNKLTQM